NASDSCSQPKLTSCDAPRIEQGGENVTQQAVVTRWKAIFIYHRAVPRIALDDHQCREADPMAPADSAARTVSARGVGAGGERAAHRAGRFVEWSDWVRRDASKNLCKWGDAGIGRSRDSRAACSAIVDPPGRELSGRAGDHRLIAHIRPCRSAVHR